MRDVVQELIGIGFTEYDAKAYSTLLRWKLLTAKQISQFGGVPRGRIYDVLEQLIQKGFCIVVPGAVKKFMAVNPESAIDSLIEQQRRREDEMREIGEFLRGVYDDQEDNSPSIDFVQVYTTESSIVERFHDLAKNTERIVRSFSTAPYADAKPRYDPSKAPRHVSEQTGRNVIVKALWEIEEANLEDFALRVHAFVRQGEEARIARSLPMKLVIYDESSVYFVANKGDVLRKHPKAILVQHTDLTAAMIDLFEYHWEDSVPFDGFVAERNLQEVIERGAADPAPGTQEGDSKC